MPHWCIESGIVNRHFQAPIPFVYIYCKMFWVCMFVSRAHQSAYRVTKLVIVCIYNYIHTIRPINIYFRICHFELFVRLFPLTLYPTQQPKTHQANVEHVDHLSLCFTSTFHLAIVPLAEADNHILQSAFKWHRWIAIYRWKYWWKIMLLIVMNTQTQSNFASGLSIDTLWKSCFRKLCF